MISKILYLTYDGLLDSLGQSQILPYLNGLADKGFQIYVISFEKIRDKEALKQTWHSNLNWHPLPYHKKPPILGTLWDIYTLNKLAFLIVKKLNINIVHCRSYVTSLIGLRLKKQLGVKFIFDMRGFWADERVEGGLWNLKNPVFQLVYKYFKKKEQAFIKYADSIISLTETAKNEIINNKNLSAKRPDIEKIISVIPTCVDTELFNPNRISNEEQDKLRSKLGIKNQEYVLLYLGSISTWYMLNQMLEFYLVLKKEKPNSKFLFITTESNAIIQAAYERICKTANLPNGSQDLIIRKAVRNQIPLYISISQSSLFFINPTYSKKASNATKMGEIMAMGKPIISNIGWGDMEELFDKHKLGVLVEEFNMEDYHSAVDKLMRRDWDNYEIRSTAFNIYGLEIGITKYIEAYKIITHKINY